MHCEVSVEIPAPTEAVWAIAQNPSRRTEWDRRVKSYGFDGPPAVGRALIMRVRMGFIAPEVTGRVLRWEPPRQSVIKTETSTSVLVPCGAGSWTFEPIPGGTRLTSRFTLDDSRLPSWVSRRVYFWVLTWDTKRSFRRLRRLVMSEQGMGER